MKAVRDLYRLTHLACVEMCVRANERAVATARSDLADALDARDRARADCHDLLHAPRAEPVYLRVLTERMRWHAGGTLDAQQAAIRG